VKWLFPVTSNWVSSCVASVYTSNSCIHPRSNNGDDLRSRDVSTGCPDVSRVNLYAIEHAEAHFEGGNDDFEATDQNELACFSRWTCLCVRVDAAAPLAHNVMNNGTHGAVAVSDAVTAVDLKGVSVSYGVGGCTWLFAGVRMSVFECGNIHCYYFDGCILKCA
jgi:hypothetical protein